MIPFFESLHPSASIFNIDRITFPFHLHDEIELLYLRGGSVSVLLPDRQILLKPGSLFIAFPNTVHGYASDGAADILVFISALNLCGSHQKQLSGHMPLHPVVEGRNLHRDVLYCLHGLSLMARPIRDTAVCSAYLQLMLCRLLPSLNIVKVPDAVGLAPLILTYISENFREPLSLESVARHAGVNKCYLSRFFNQKLLVGFPDYLHTLRVNLAMEMLLKTDFSIGYISDYCGYDNFRTFNRAFKSKAGLTPSEWQKTQTALLLHEEVAAV